MVARVRKRMTYTNVALTLALVFSMTGGAYAAGKYLITSTKQIKPSVLKSLKGANGKNGVAGPAGPAGPAGLAGPAGPGGPAGKDGTNGTNGTNGQEGKVGSAGTLGPTGPKGLSPTGPTGPVGAPWPDGGTLPSGATETGTYVFVARALGLEEQAFSFSIPLKAPLDNTHFIEETSSHNGKNDTPECEGTVEEPKATAGNLCMYYNIGEGKSVVLGVTSEGISGALAIFDVTQLNNGEDATSNGSWAVTAP
jgi:hypothetical protein